MSSVLKNGGAKVNSQNKYISYFLTLSNGRTSKKLFFPAPSPISLPRTYLGLQGGGICFCSRSSHSMVLKKGCVMISMNPPSCKTEINNCFSSKSFRLHISILINSLQEAQNTNIVIIVSVCKKYFYLLIYFGFNNE